MQTVNQIPGKSRELRAVIIARVDTLTTARYRVTLVNSFVGQHPSTFSHNIQAQRVNVNTLMNDERIAGVSQ